MNRPTKLCVRARLASYEKMYPKSGAMLPTIKAVKGSLWLLKRCNGRTAAAWETVKGTAASIDEGQWRIARTRVDHCGC